MSLHVPALLTVFSPATASATTVSFLEQTSYATYDDYLVDPYLGGGEPLADGGSVSNDNAYVAHRVLVNSPSEGDLLEWNTIDPSGNVEAYRYAEYVYDEVEQAWCYTGTMGDYCGPSSSTTWTWLTSILFHETGPYVTDVSLNGEVMVTTVFVLTGDDGGDPPPDPEPEVTCTQGMWEVQIEPTNTTLPDPYIVITTDEEGAPLAGIEVAFSVVSTPPGAKDESLEGDGQYGESILTTTGDDGVASATLTLGSKEGLYAVDAQCDGGESFTFESIAAPYVTGVTLIEQWEGVPLSKEFFLYEGEILSGAAVLDQKVEPVGGELGDRIVLDMLVLTEHEDLDSIDVVWSAEYGKGKGKGTITGGQFGTTWNDIRAGFIGTLTMELPADTKGKAGQRPHFDTFGRNTLTLDFSFYNGDDFLGEQQIVTELHLFFPKNDIYPTTPPSDVPNWAFYWNQIPEIQELEDDPPELWLDRSFIGEGLPGPSDLFNVMRATYMKGPETETNPNGGDVFYSINNHAHRFWGPRCDITEPTSALAFVRIPSAWGTFTDDHTDAMFCGPFDDANDFADTIFHEHVHLTDWYYFWAPEYADWRPVEAAYWTDIDNDGYPDQVVSFTAEYHLFHADVQFLWDSEVNTWRREAIEAQDWSNPGPNMYTGSPG